MNCLGDDDDDDDDDDDGIIGVHSKMIILCDYLADTFWIF